MPEQNLNAAHVNVEAFLAAKDAGQEAFRADKDWHDITTAMLEAYIRSINALPAQPDTVHLVTIKLPKNPAHDPKNKITAECVVSPECTDSTGEHHTIAVRTDAEVDALREKFGHMTRIEQVVLPARNDAQLELQENSKPIQNLELIAQVQEAIDHEHLDPREFVDLRDVLYELKHQAMQAQPIHDQRAQRMLLGKPIAKALRQCGISVRYALAGPGELFDVAGILLREYPALAAAQSVSVSDEPGVYDMGSPEPEGVESVVECDKYGNTTDYHHSEAFLGEWHKTTDGTRWKGYQDGKVYMTWDELMRRVGPVKEAS